MLKTTIVEAVKANKKKILVGVGVLAGTVLGAVLLAPREDEEFEGCEDTESYESDNNVVELPTEEA